uniref:3-hydroxyanthranilate 3,4-dioxygenase-like n=1 Tax=Ciona intestinalis TaxID=7719 RepID=UPI000180B73E|nr:3-hydroxyanthranilate 3,4-dioxygenase-like [Ciona intestinalis]|eukprot:XP_002119902.1 3-hydroxyanthranilate 3,4-dioxygenase-like [Ciona intestinalis]
MLKVINLNQWVSENKSQFLPPVCNKMMHNMQLKIMCIGGPNQRKDYHIEEGEEFFYMIKGDMCLKIVENGKHKDVVIKQGEVFLLPPRIPHSPQRFEDTVGLVIERERHENETDVLRYFVGESTDILYEKTFHSVDLGTELPPMIDQYFNSEEYKTGVPNPSQASKKIPFNLNLESVSAPKLLSHQLDNNATEFKLFEGDLQSNVEVISSGVKTSKCDVETWFWQIMGTSVVYADGKEFTLNGDDTLLIPPNVEYKLKAGVGCKVIKMQQKREMK